MIFVNLTMYLESKKIKKRSDMFTFRFARSSSCSVVASSFSFVKLKSGDDCGDDFDWI